ncbi:aminotransferase class V-fold PLP-dependent enzyme [Sediminicoccus sp. KRV36]|uniref:pyridoxal phosphate-dependent decarboxylase family protein n=1 Tax=Sediminicoccus sp. KRV36 TaxID=3133721 RepID=UPI00200C463C|nr:aminotransferase class V-fold PLP-dependent enzyme [Sediminicoccus rosea]UPY37143.1 aminotransferase class V-fold PLP-dependent enzyme [Sediminicoccus rosea]
MIAIPEEGQEWPALKQALLEAKARDYSWKRGRMAVFFYYLDEALERVQQEAYLTFWTENNLGQRAFPSLARLEGEVVEMGLSLMRAPEGAGGTFTSGGSESIFLAMLAAREKAGVARPNIVIPDTAHLTFDRAGWYLGLEVRRIPTAADRRSDIVAMMAAMDANTVALVGSAPNYPFGGIDRIAELGALAAARGVWLHVDACVGGFLSPFLSRLGVALPDWDFAVPGVTSISADIHKHGMAPKGASLLLLRDAGLKQHHRFESKAWARGLYAAHTAQGTRPGGAVAAAWAVMRHLGQAGYLDCARRIREARSVIAAGIQTIPGLEVLPGEHAILVYRSHDPGLPIGRVATILDGRGWLVSRQQEPDGIHLHLNPLHAEVAEEYLADLRLAVAEARAGAAPEMAAGRAY